MAEPPTKNRKIEKWLDKKWLLEFLSDHNADSMTKKQSGSYQRVSISPRYLELRPEDELLQVLLALVEGGSANAKEWWIQTKYKNEREFKYVFRERLAIFIQNLLTTTQNVKIYVATMVLINNVVKQRREKCRAKLFHIKVEDAING